MRLLNILNYFAQVSEVMNRRDNSFSSEEINRCNDQLAEIADDALGISRSRGADIVALGVSDYDHALSLRISCSKEHRLDGIDAVHLIVSELEL